MGEKVIGVFILIVWLAMVSVIFSKRANTAKVLEAFLKGFSNTIKTAKAL
jgi:PRD1 phage membrane DNA delivery